MTFEEAIAQTQSLLLHIEQRQLSESEQQQTIASLVQTENGARGFFVTYLSDDRALFDQPSSAVVQALRSSPKLVSELLVKNLAMSSAMGVFHRRNQNSEMAQGSDRVRSRTTTLMQRLQMPAIADRLAQLRETITAGVGEYQSFLERWGYDDEQKQHILQMVEQVGLSLEA